MKNFLRYSLRICGAAVIMGALMMLAVSCNSKPAEYSEEFGEGLKLVYELGLVDSKNAGFTAEGQLTNADAVMLASRIYAELNSETVPSRMGEWYKSYYSYAEKKGLPTASLGEPEAAVSRGSYAALLAAAAKSALSPINSIESIPDIPESKEYAGAVLELYNAGITLGSDSAGRFFPGSPITRLEAADHISRIFGGEKLTGTLEKAGSHEGYSIILNSSWNAMKEGISSGWQLDNRGGIPRNSLLDGYGALSDISEEAGTALIREFNRIDSGVVDFYTRLSVDGNDGAYIEFRSESGASVWRCEIIDGVWQVVSDGGNTELCDALRAAFDFRITLDLNNRRYSAEINGTDYGTYPLSLSADELDLAELRYGTTDAGTPTVTPLITTLSADYPLCEDFTYLTNGKPHGAWTFEEASADYGALTLSEGGSAAVSFEPVSGRAIAEFMVLYTKEGKTSLALRSGEREVALFTADSAGFSVNGESVYTCEYDSLWYRIRFELDNSSETMLIKINGREIKTLPFALSATSIDNIFISNGGAEEALLDDFRVFREYDREDYVPEPKVPEDKTGYTVGMNVCSLWRNGAHFGWSCISPYDDPVPVLGYYDEGVPETADWEIKYIVEHGIDFQAFCVYMDEGEEPQRPDAAHLYNGFMNAKYSSLSQFCIIWECMNGGSPYSLEEWKEYYVPYFIENFFKDPRHVTIDGKLVMCVFSPDTLKSRLGSNANVKDAFAYLDEEVKKLGFDGMIYLACGSSTNAVAAMGFDGCYAYHWGDAGHDLDVNISSILSSAKQGAVYTVPTVSVGFNSIPWHGTRHPMMSAEDYAAAHEWVKTEYLPKYAKEDWQKNFVMLSTWNEYGEGTYIMPTADERGFSYLDVLREAYTDEKADPSLNTSPTDAQKARITHLYPQDLHLLRREGYYSEDVSEFTQVLYDVDFATEKIHVANVSGQKITADGISGKASNASPMMQIAEVEHIDLDQVDYVRIVAKLEAGTTMKVYYTTEADGAWNEAKGKLFPASVGDTSLTEYIISADQLPNFTGKLAGFRVDPSKQSGVNFTIKSVEFVKELRGVGYSLTVNIDGNELKQNIRPADNEAGAVCIAFDPAAGIDFALNSFHDWDKDSGVLTLNFKKHTAVFTVGKESYIFDGKEIALGCKLGAVDGLPMIPIAELCEKLGYVCRVEGDVVTVETDLIDYYRSQSGENTGGSWEFNTAGSNEGWVSGNMQLVVSPEGYMSCESTTASRDPIIDNQNAVSLDTGKYTRVEMRVRYKHDADAAYACFYFATDSDPALDEAKTIKVTLESSSTGDDWVIIKIDLTEIATWKGICTKLRFDPFNAVGHMDIDYIRFLGD